LLMSWRPLTKIARFGSASRSGSGSISQTYGSANPYPDPHQNFMDPQYHGFKWTSARTPRNTRQSAADLHV
jgi:hypothetical protein